MTCILSATDFPFTKSGEFIVSCYCLPQLTAAVAPAPGIPLLELGGRRILPTSSDPPSTLSVPEKRVTNLRCSITAASSSAVRVINWYIDNQNVSHNSQFLMEYSAATDEYLSLSILTLNVTKDLHGKRVTCLCENSDVSSSTNRPALQVTALFDVMCEYSDSCPTTDGRRAVPSLELHTISIEALCSHVTAKSVASRPMPLVRPAVPSLRGLRHPSCTIYVPVPAAYLCLCVCRSGDAIPAVSASFPFS